MLFVYSYILDRGSWWFISSLIPIHPFSSSSSPPSILPSRIRIRIRPSSSNLSPLPFTLLRFTTSYLTLDTLSLHFIPSSPSNCILHAHHQLPERDETTTRYDTISAAPLYCACYCISSARSARLCTALPYRVYSSKTIIHSIFVHLVHLWQYCNDRHPQRRTGITSAGTLHSRILDILDCLLHCPLFLPGYCWYYRAHTRDTTVDPSQPITCDSTYRATGATTTYRDICCSPLTTTAWSDDTVNYHTIRAYAYSIQHTV